MADENDDKVSRDPGIVNRAKLRRILLSLAAESVKDKQARSSSEFGQYVRRKVPDRVSEETFLFFELKVRELCTDVIDQETWKGGQTIYPPIRTNGRS